MIELKVDDDILLQRIEKRIAEMQARGGAVRADDNAESLKKRLDAYHAQTAPLSAYYRRKGMHKATDGMAPIDEVTAAIGRLLAPAPRKKAVSARKRAARGAAGRRPAGRKPAARATPGKAASKAVSKSAPSSKAKKAAKARSPQGFGEDPQRRSRQGRAKAATGRHKAVKSRNSSRNRASKARSGRGRRLTKRR